MIQIKLDAIDSTNDYLKDLASKTSIENYTVVSTELQTKGKGQFNAVWVSEKDKNLLMSVFVSDLAKNNNQLFAINCLVSIAIIRVLQREFVENLAIKWPNDIMAGNKKIAGILIENIFTSEKKIDTIIGIGLNVNQILFENLPKATSLQLETNKNFNKEAIKIAIIKELQVLSSLLEFQEDLLWRNYLKYLFKINMPVAFKNKKGEIFMGKINGVTKDGKLRVETENSSELLYEVKQLEMLY